YSNEDFQYIWNPCFDLKGLPFKKFDILVSQAVLEHLSDIRKTFDILYNKIVSSAIMVHEVGLGAHTGFIRNLDPLNHLRYSDLIWNLLRFDGSPNRIRMTEFRKIMIDLGFKKVRTKQIATLDKEYVKNSKPYLSNRFKEYLD
ncbi:unnamed protein product, partial [marine sediment metagenome]